MAPLISKNKDSYLTPPCDTGNNILMYTSNKRPDKQLKIDYLPKVIQYFKVFKLLIHLLIGQGIDRAKGDLHYP